MKQSITGLGPIVLGVFWSWRRKGKRVQEKGGRVKVFSILYSYCMLFLWKWKEKSGVERMELEEIVKGQPQTHSLPFPLFHFWQGPGRERKLRD
jgi:hypothetical protein